jgi:aryl-alcohol dehydrogenase-like predicted oxidoreductase
VSRLALGTVQFGLDYGVSNRDGQVVPEMAARIVSAAFANSIDTYDTSPAYGESENVLGNLLPAGSKVISKVSRIPDAIIGNHSLESCHHTFEKSLRALRVGSLYGLLVHWADDLLKEGADRLYTWMQQMKEVGRVARIGVSVYDSSQIDRILEKFPIDIIQIPLNALDQRLLHSGHIEMLKERGVEIHVRSVFLQGLLLMKMSDIPAYFRPYHDDIKEFHSTAARAGLTPLELSLGFVMGMPEVDMVVVGVNSDVQLREIVTASRTRISPDMLSKVASTEAGLLNPSLWEAARK